MSLRTPKKLRKRRGSRTHGYGRVGQHRKSGMRAGKGFSGMKKQGKSWILANMPDYFGKEGFRRPDAACKKVNPITLREVDRLLKEYSLKPTASSAKVISIDLGKHGYNKLLSTGYLSAPAEIIVDKATSSAISKVESAGGKVILPSKE